MKGRIVLIALMALASMPFSVFAENDTINQRVRDLEEVVVEGRTQRVIENGVEYRPDKRMKKASFDAASLLLRMQIPQLDIKPGSDEIKTLVGDGVSIFIDYMPASQMELKGLRTDDVLAVEVLQHPKDPRFKGAAHVVNFKMRKYEWGGYTKLTAQGVTLSKDELSGNLYSRFSYKRMVFDAAVMGSLTHNNDYRSAENSTFRDIIYDGKKYDEISRRETVDRNLSRLNGQWGFFRAAYSHNNFYMHHIVMFNRDASPYRRRSGEVSFSEGLAEARRSSTFTSNQLISPSITGYYSLILPKNSYMQASWSFAYGSRIANSLYEVSGLSPIVNDNRERIYTPTVDIYYSKQFRHNNNLFVQLISINNIFDTHYSGSYTGIQKFTSSETMLFLQYNQTWKNGLYLYTRLGGSYSLGRLNGENILSSFNPRIGFQLQYRPGGKHFASIDCWWANTHPEPNTSNGAIVRRNELLWSEGNPDLKNSYSLRSTASYNFIPNNSLSLSANFRYDTGIRKQAYLYYSDQSHEGLIRKAVNSGNIHTYLAWVSANWKLFNKSLSLSAAGFFRNVGVYGIDRRNESWFSGEFSASYYYRNFSFMLYYNTPDRTMSEESRGVLYRDKASYGMNLTYGTGNFRMSLRFSNWFNSNPYRSGDYSSFRYSFRNSEWSLPLARALQLSLSYTLPYGKKIYNNGELDRQGSVDSAILK